MLETGIPRPPVPHAVAVPAIEDNPCRIHTTDSSVPAALSAAAVDWAARGQGFRRRNEPHFRRRLVRRTPRETADSFRSMSLHPGPIAQVFFRAALPPATAGASSRPRFPDECPPGQTAGVRRVGRTQIANATHNQNSLAARLSARAKRPDKTERVGRTGENIETRHVARLRASGDAGSPKTGIVGPRTCDSISIRGMVKRYKTQNRAPVNCYRPQSMSTVRSSAVARHRRTKFCRKLRFASRKVRSFRIWIRRIVPTVVVVPPLRSRSRPFLNRIGR